MQLQTVPLQEFVGHSQERSAARDALWRAIQGHGSILFVAGESGAGKTVFLDCVATEARAEFPELVVARGEGNAQTGASDAYLPWREILRSLLGYQQRSPNAAGAAALGGMVGRIVYEVGPDLVGTFVPFAGLGLRGVQSLLGMLGLKVKAPRTTPASVDQSRVFEQYSEVLQRTSEKKPLLLVFDDLHWSDEASIALLFFLGRRIHASRILIVCTYRPQEFEIVGDDRMARLRHVVNELRRYGAHMLSLDQPGSTEGDRAAIRRFVQLYVDRMLTPHSLPPITLDMLAERTGGNPLFLSEVLSWLIERRALVKENGTWSLGINAPAVESLPERVEAVVQERIGLLTDELKRLLTDASVEGEDFSAQVLATLHGLEERSVLGRLFEDLARAHHLVEEHGEKTLREDRILSLFRFRHRILRDHLYNTLGESQRRMLHKEVGECLEALYQEDTSIIASRLAQHFEIAKDYRRALRYHRDAARQAARGFAAAEASRAYSSALDAWKKLYVGRVVPGVAEQRERLHMLREAGDVAEYIGNHTRAEECHREALSIAESLGDPRERLLALGNLGDVCRLRVQYRDAERFYKEVERLAGGDNELLAEVFCDLAELYGDVLYCNAGQHLCPDKPPELLNNHLITEAKNYAKRAVDAAGVSGQPETMRRVYQLLSELARHSRAFDEAVQFARQSLEVSESHRLNMHALNTLGELCRLQGDLPGARSYYEQFRKWADASGSARERGAALNNLGIVTMDGGDVQSALKLFDESLNLSEMTNDRECLAETFAMKGVALVRAGRHGDALDAFRSSLAVDEIRAESGGLPEVLLLLVHQLLARADVDKATELLRYAEEAGAAPDEIAAFRKRLTA